MERFLGGGRSFLGFIPEPLSFLSRPGSVSRIFWATRNAVTSTFGSKIVIRRKNETSQHRYTFTYWAVPGSFFFCRSAAEKAQHPHHLGRRYWHLQRQRLQHGHDGLQDAQHRPHWQRRRYLHRLVRPTELHSRPCSVHHRTVPDPHRSHQSWTTRRAGRHDKRG